MPSPPPTRQQLADAARRKASGFVRGLEKITPEERVVKPSAAFADDYNRTRELTGAAYPHLESQLPPKATVTGESSVQAYREYQVWIEQIMGFVMAEERKTDQQRKANAAARARDLDDLELGG